MSQPGLKGNFNCRILIGEYFDSMINDIDIYVEDFLNNKAQSKSNNEIDYIQKTRMKCIEELNKLKHAFVSKFTKSPLKMDYDPGFADEKLDTIWSQLFPHKFCFLLRKSNIKFEILIVIVDYYLEKKYISYLE